MRTLRCRLATAAEPAANAVEPDRPVERAGRDDRVTGSSSMQMPAQPLLGACVARQRDQSRCIDEQLQLPQRSAHSGRRPIEIAAPATRPCATASASIGSDLPARPYLSAACGAGQLRRHPHQPLRPQRSSCTLERAGHMPAILERPQPLARRSVRRPDQATQRPDHSTVSSPSSRARPRRRQQPSTSTCVRPLRSRSLRSPPTDAGGDRRADRPHSRQAAKLLSGHARRSREGGGDTTLASQITRADSPKWSQPPLTRVCVVDQTPPPTENDSEFGNVA